MSRPVCGDRSTVTLLKLYPFCNTTGFPRLLNTPFSFFCRKDTCQGDSGKFTCSSYNQRVLFLLHDSCYLFTTKISFCSGGPIIDKASGLQVGIVSFGIGCADAEYAGVNARVSGAVEWIFEMICDLTDYPSPGLCGADAAPSVMPKGPGGLTVNIVYDDYPEEVAWRITHEDSGTQFFFQAFEEVSQEELVAEYPFDQLPAGRYLVEFGDDAEGTFLSLDVLMPSERFNNSHEIAIFIQMESVATMAKVHFGSQIATAESGGVTGVITMSIFKLC